MSVNQIIAVYSNKYFELEQLLEMLPVSGDDEYPNWADYDYFFWGCWQRKLSTRCERKEEYVYVIQISNNAYLGYMAKKSRFPLKLRMGMNLKKFLLRGVACVKQNVIYHWDKAEYDVGLSLEDLRRNRMRFIGVIASWLEKRGYYETANGSAKWVCTEVPPFIERLAIDAAALNEESN